MKTTKISVSIKMGSIEVKTSTDISVCESKPRRRAAVARLVARLTKMLEADE